MTALPAAVEMGEAAHAATVQPEQAARRARPRPAPASGARRRGSSDAPARRMRSRSAWRAEAALGHEQSLRPGPAAPAPPSSRDRPRRVLRLRLLTPISSARRRSARSSSASSWTSTSTSMPSSVAALLELGRLRRRRGRHDEQDAVGAERPRLDHLVGVEDEVLAQHRQRHRLRGRAQVGVAALEEGLVGEHREAGGTACGIGAGQGGGSKSARIRPRLGEAFLISAIRPKRPVGHGLPQSAARSRAAASARQRALSSARDARACGRPRARA